VKNIVLPIRNINRIEFNSGSDGGVEGMMPGILFGTVAGFMTCIVIEKMKEKDTPAYDNYGSSPDRVGK
jgi:hypothetical protein